MNTRGINAERFIASISCQFSTICNYQTYGGMHGLREISLAAANMLSDAFNERAAYFSHFANSFGDDVYAYNLAHRNGPSSRTEQKMGVSKKQNRQKNCFLDYFRYDRLLNSVLLREKKMQVLAQCITLIVIHTYNVLSEQCISRHLKLLDVSIMTRTEGVSKAFSVLLSTFSHLPKVVHYDNSCNIE